MAKRTEISELGEFGLIAELTRDIVALNPSTVHGVGDDAAVIEADGCGGADGSGSGDGLYTLLSTDMLLEGVNFDLVYFPLKHLGYKVVTTTISEILAKNAYPKQLI